MASHALLSASGAYRWSVCTKAPRFEAEFQDSESVYALEGTIAHAVGEFCLKSFDMPEETFAMSDIDRLTEAEVPELLQLEKVHGEEWRNEVPALLRYVERYVDYVLSLPGERYIEKRVDFSHLVPEGFGTSDAIILNGDAVDVVDLKYGKGKKVYADGPQAKLYALGALHDYGFIFDNVKTVRLHIVQPRLDHIDVHEMSLEELVAYGEWISKRAEIAWRGDGEFVPGNHCDFCRARHVCKARADANMAVAMEEFGEPCPSADRLTLEQIASLLPRLDQIAKWAGEVQDYALGAALNGTKVPGYKVVEGRSTRKWVDEGQVADAMRAEGLTNEQIYNMKLVGLTEAEKLLGKKSPVFELAVKAPGKPVLVPETDKRAEIGIASASRDFAEEA